MTTDSGTHLVRMNSISRGGASILFEKNLNSGTIISLKHEELRVLAKVIHKEETEQGWLLCLEFFPTCLEDVLVQEKFLAIYKHPVEKLLRT